MNMVQEPQEPTPFYTMDNCPGWLLNMPKTDLHCHMGGSMRIGTILELAKEYKVDIPYKDEASLKAVLTGKAPHDCHKEDEEGEKALQSYLDRIKICESVLKKPEAFERVAYEISEDAAKENVKIFELRFGPTNYMSKDMHVDKIVESTINGLKRAEKDFNMHTGLILCGIRTDMDSVRITAQLAALFYRYGVVGMDLAGQEKHYRAGLYEEALRDARYAYVPMTVHCGEVDDSVSIKEAIFGAHAKRLGHARTIINSSDLMGHANENRIAIETCLKSNLDTRAVRLMATHPIKIMLKEQLRVSINTDNRTISDTNITKEYLSLMNDLGFNHEKIYKLAINGVKSAFMRNEKRQAYLTDLMNYFLPIFPDLKGKFLTY